MDTPSSALRIDLEHFGADTSDVTVASRAVVEGLNVIGHVGARQLPILVDVFLDPFFRQARTERLSDRVILAVASPAHARLKSICAAEAPPVITAILASLIGMDHGAPWASAPHSHHDGV